MIELRKTYPLYLANEARQPNADLEVTDKYTGEVAFRTALADAATIDAGIGVGGSQAGHITTSHLCQSPKLRGTQSVPMGPQKR